jgi:hypothetical protein
VKCAEKWGLGVGGRLESRGTGGDPAELQTYVITAEAGLSRGVIVESS